MRNIFIISLVCVIVKQVSSSEIFRKYHLDQSSLDNIPKTKMSTTGISSESNMGYYNENTKIKLK